MNNLKITKQFWEIAVFYGVAIILMSDSWGSLPDSVMATGNAFG